MFNAMKNHLTTKRIVIAIVLVLLFGAYLNFSSPGRVVVSDTGEVKGLVNILRMKLQGARFWRDQLQEVNKTLAWKLAEPERDAAFERELSQLEDEIREDEEQMYRQHPELRPTEEEQRAKALRDQADALMRQADALEMARFDREIEQFHIEKIAELRRIKKRVEALAK